uniref:Uncharacterized protein n=1 Tax=Ixodes scapularis TaxID=6945 RepID=A0A4D5RC03_IXOSC
MEPFPLPPATSPNPPHVHWLVVCVGSFAPTSARPMSRCNNCKVPGLRVAGVVQGTDFCRVVLSSVLFSLRLPFSKCLFHRRFSVGGAADSARSGLLFVREREL